MRWLSTWVFRETGAAFMGVYASDMVEDLPGLQRPLFAILLAVSIVMFVRLLEEA